MLLILLLGLILSTAATAKEALPETFTLLQSRLLARFDRLLEDPQAYARRVQTECHMFPEGFLFPFTFPVQAYANLAIADLRRREHARRQMIKLIDLAIPRVARRVKPPGNDLMKLKTYQRQATCLGQLNLALGAYALVSRDGRYQALHKHLSDLLQRALEAADGRPLKSFPHYSWPFDTIPVLLGLALYDRDGRTGRSGAAIARHLAWVNKHATHAKLGLPYSRIETSEPELPRGCDLSLRLCLLAHLDRPQAEALYRNYTRHHWLERGLIAGFAEWPDGITRYEDLDSGPIVWGIGLGATGLGIGTTIAMRDRKRMERLAGLLAMGKALLPLIAGADSKIGGMIDFDPRYLTGFLFGDAVLFYALTWQPWMPSDPSPPGPGRSPDKTPGDRNADR